MRAPSWLGRVELRLERSSRQRPGRKWWWWSLRNLTPPPPPPCIVVADMPNQYQYWFFQSILEKGQNLSKNKITRKKLKICQKLKKKVWICTQNVIIFVYKDFPEILSAILTSLFFKMSISIFSERLCWFWYLSISIFSQSSYQIFRNYLISKTPTCTKV